MRGEKVSAPGCTDLQGAARPHLPVEDHRVLAVGGGGGVGVGRLRRHWLDGDETQGAGVIFVGVWEGKDKTSRTEIFHANCKLASVPRRTSVQQQSHFWHLVLRNFI